MIGGRCYGFIVSDDVPYQAMMVLSARAAGLIRQKA